MKIGRRPGNMLNSILQSTTTPSAYQLVMRHLARRAQDDLRPAQEQQASHHPASPIWGRELWMPTGKRWCWTCRVNTEMTIRNLQIQRNAPARLCPISLRLLMSASLNLRNRCSPVLELFQSPSSSRREIRGNRRSKSSMKMKRSSSQTFTQQYSRTCHFGVRAPARLHLDTKFSTEAQTRRLKLSQCHSTLRFLITRVRVPKN